MDWREKAGCRVYVVVLCEHRLASRSLGGLACGGRVVLAADERVRLRQAVHEEGWIARR